MVLNTRRNFDFSAKQQGCDFEVKMPIFWHKKGEGGPHFVKMVQYLDRAFRNIENPGK